MTAIGTEFARVLTRWNPSGITRLRAALDAPDPYPRIRVVADHGVDVDGVLGRLADSCPDPHHTDAPAGIALVLLDASAPIGRAMLTRLRQVPDSTRVVIVLDGIDRHQDWDVVAARNRTLLAEYVPRLATVPIRPAASRVVDDRSEIATDLAAAAAGTAAEWESRNLLCLVDEVVGEARRSLAAHARTAAADANLAAARSERGDLIAERARAGADRSSLVRSRIQRVRLDALHDVGSEIRAVSTAATHAIDRAGTAAMRTFPVDFAREIDSAASRLDRSVGGRLDSVRNEIGGPDVASTAVVAPTDIDTVPAARSRGADEWLAGLVGLSAGAGFARLIGALTGPTPVLSWILTTVLALAVGGTTVAVRRRAADRATLRRWATEIVADVRPRWEQSILSALLDAEATITASLTAAARDRTKAVDRLMVGVDDRIRAGAAEVAGRNAAYERDLAALERGADAVRRAVEPRTAGVRPSP
ncbi:hypothetical protein GCM10007304_04180 [Rhodococcoides trifolii]|uniref:Uncharacterized protein n=1 Tax=Rhodococcoides trifolii TaxID=908250 RepID=A0A917FPV0_9NOCA|nr:hypothetical protein [Rhodococcus trifolii]GGF93460.1 hypothetical protein GCM10007304_04180 [Rhodococcus trifolii]